MEAIMARLPMSMLDCLSVGLETELSWTNLRSPSVMVRPLVGVLVPLSCPLSEKESLLCWFSIILTVSASGSV